MWLFPTLKFHAFLAVSCFLSQNFRVQSRLTIIFRPCPKICTPSKNLCTPNRHLISGRINGARMVILGAAGRCCTGQNMMSCRARQAWCLLQITRMSREKESAAKQVQELLASLLAAQINATQRVDQWQEALQEDGNKPLLEPLSTKTKVL